MNLLRYDIHVNTERIYFNNVSLNEFLNLFVKREILVLGSIYAHTPEREYNVNDFLQPTTLNDFLRLKNNIASLFYDSIEFTIEKMDVRISNEYEYIISTVESSMSLFIEKLFGLIEVDISNMGYIIANSGKYILLDNGNILTTFDSFDEYLNSEYSDIS